MKTTTYKELTFKSGDVIPANTEIEVLPLRHKTENKSHPTKCRLFYNDKEYGCNYISVFEQPPEREILSMVFDSNCQSVGGQYDIEPDGFDPEGFPSWLQALGIV